MAKVLLVDDNVDMQKMLTVVLKRQNHDIVAADRGQQCLELAQSEPFDVVVLDVMMPDMNGYEVARRLRTDDRTRDLPIIILTARAQAIDQAAAMDAGADAYLAKPVDIAELNNKIQELTTQGRPRPTAPAAPPPAAPPPVYATAAPVYTPAPAPAPAAQPKPQSRVISVVCLRGGVGATSLAVNLAGSLARDGRRVCLIDMSPASGHAALMLRLRAKPNWSDLPADINPQSLGFALLKHDTGLQLLAAPTVPQRDGLGSDKFKAVIAALSAFFTDIVVDCAPVLDSGTLAAVAAASRLLLPLAPEVTAVQTMTGTLAALATLQVPLDELRLVLNQPTPNPTLLPARIENALKRPLDASLPFDPAMSAALLQGAPLFASQPHSAYMAALSNLIQKL